jgi:hypothetical protein
VSVAVGVAERNQRIPPLSAPRGFEQPDPS